jgi:hypothetical protein
VIILSRWCKRWCRREIWDCRQGGCELWRELKEVKAKKPKRAAPKICKLNFNHILNLGNISRWRMKTLPATMNSKDALCCPN